MDKNLEISLLFDFYGSLLTDKQREVVDLYYNEDLSLAEIADQLDITRQGVHDNIRRSEKQLVQYENLLGLCDRFSKVSHDLDLLAKEIEKLTFDASEKERIVRMMNEIKELL